MGLSIFLMEVRSRTTPSHPFILFFIFFADAPPTFPLSHPQWFVNNKEYAKGGSLALPLLGLSGVAFGCIIMAVIGIWA